MQVNGYNDKMHLLLEKILGCMNSIQIKPDRFAVIKEQVQRELKNFDLESPYQHAMYYTNQALQERLWTFEEKLVALGGTFCGDIIHYCRYDRRPITKLLSQPFKGRPY